MKEEILEALGGYVQENGVFFTKGPAWSMESEQLYLQVREAEQRIYSDQEVRGLPFLMGHKHSSEWALRTCSYNRLMKYFRAKKECVVLLGTWIPGDGPALLPS